MKPDEYDAGVKLSSSSTVADYLLMLKSRDGKALENFARVRFEERYLDPIESQPRNGFAMMAVGCLMIEALESFRQGWKDSNRKSAESFRSFFAHWDEFAAFRPVAADFYEHVRCGILHQAETTGSWRVVRSGPMRDERTINAAKFTAALRRVLAKYASSLRTEDWESETLVAFRKKMEFVCRNTVR